MRDEVQAMVCPTTKCIQMQTKVKSRTTLAIVSTLEVRSKTFLRSHNHTNNMDFSNLIAEQVAQLRAALDAAPPLPSPPESSPPDAAPSSAPAAEKRQAPERGAAEKADSPSPARKKKTPKKDRKKKKKSSSAKRDAALAGPFGGFLADLQQGPATNASDSPITMAGAYENLHGATTRFVMCRSSSLVLFALCACLLRVIAHCRVPYHHNINAICTNCILASTLVSSSQRCGAVRTEPAELTRKPAE